MTKINVSRFLWLTV